MELQNKYVIALIKKSLVTMSADDSEIIRCAIDLWYNKFSEVEKRILFSVFCNAAEPHHGLVRLGIARFNSEAQYEITTDYNTFKVFLCDGVYYSGTKRPVNKEIIRKSKRL